MAAANQYRDRSRRTEHTKGGSSVYAWVRPETRRLVDTLVDVEGYESRSDLVRRALREHLDLPTEEPSARADATDNEQATLLTDGGHSFDFSES